MSEPCHRGCICDCDCCAGVEVSTPEETANRPGLDALACRVGTHATFFETMQARLSSRPALAGLATRAADDFSIALLDAWATAADVLTFYQERLANEGYLRTATERRSVLELARLVGYQPRPGVAASTWLAFTLDAGPEVVIPAGARAQSIPGPGELPQPFETGEDLKARAAWNLLPMRQTRPQLADDAIKDGALYLQGIATRLRPNDPLLIRTVAGAKPALYRVMTVEPDAQASRTRVTFEPWLGAQEKQQISTPQAEPSPTVFQEIAERWSDPERSEIPLDRAASRRVVSLLEPLRAGEEPEGGAPALRALVAEQILPALRDEHGRAVAGNYTRIEPGITHLIAELEGALGGAPADPQLTALAGPMSVIGTIDAVPATTDLASVLGSLAQKPSQPPPNPLRLPRDVGQAFDPRSDTTARLALATRPELRGALYTAWASVPIAPPPVLEVWALRLNAAAVFGHNAPLELVRNADGVIVGSREWKLCVSGGDFRIELLFPDTATINTLSAPQAAPINLALTIRATLDGETAAIDLPNLSAQSFSISVPNRDTIQGAISVSPDPLKISFVCPPRGFTVTFILTPGTGDETRFQVTIEGADPDTFSISNDSTHLVATGHDLRAITLEKSDVVNLDNAYPQILPGSWIVLERPAPENLRRLVITTAVGVSEQSRAAYGLTGKSTRVQLSSPDTWLDLKADCFSVIRGTAVYAQSERLELAQGVVTEDVCGGNLELAGLLDGLEPGRWLIVSGERTDVTGAPQGSVTLFDEDDPALARVPGVPAAELVMVAGVDQGAQEIVDGDSRRIRPGELAHTTLTLAAPLAYCYRRDTVKVWGNVAPATHGETKAEVLGSGDASQARQRFALKQSPLTYVSAPTPSGIASTLRVRVNDLLWHEAESVFGLTPTDRAYTTRRSDAEITTVVFGDGRRGARPPSGSENLRAVYRIGLGRPGNLDAGRISQLVTRPLGVKDVINPLPATGGADAESRDRARANAPLAVMALDRLVGVEDYADFARTFAGIGRAHAVRLSNGRTQLVHVTVAGEDDIPIADSSDLLRNLAAALRQFGDPHLPVQLAVRDSRLLAFAAGVRLLPDYVWEAVAPKIRAALLAALGFDRRDLAQDAVLSEALRAVQSVAGVDFVDVDLFDTVTGTLDPDELAAQRARLTQDQPKARLRARPARVEGTGASRTIRPAELIYLSPAVPDTVLLKELPA